MQSDKIKILIADDHAIVREGLKQIVAEEQDMVVLGEAENVEKLMKLLEETKQHITDCSLSDLKKKIDNDPDEKKKNMKESEWPIQDNMYESNKNNMRD